MKRFNSKQQANKKDKFNIEKRKRSASRMAICIITILLLGCGCGESAVDKEGQPTAYENEKDAVSQQTNSSQTLDDMQGIDNPQETDGNQVAVGNQKTGAEQQQELPRSLSTEELKAFMEYLNRWENYGFLLSEYESPEYMDLDQIFYSGAGIEREDLSDEERAVYEEQVGEIYTDVVRLTGAQINEFLQRKAGITLADMKAEFGWIYLEDFDCYVCQCGDTNYTSFTCTGGEEIEKGIFRIRCASDYEYGQDCVITLQAKGDEYRVLSNRYEENTEDITAVRKITGQCFEVELKGWGVVEFASYEPNVYTNPWEDVTFALLQNGEKIYEFPPVYMDNQLANLQFMEVGAVAFKDYDKDGYTDIIIICEYEFASGADAAQGYKEVRIYKGSEKGFSYMENLSLALNIEGNNETISQILQQIELEELDMSKLGEDTRRQLEIFAKYREDWLDMEWEPQMGSFAVEDLDDDGKLELIVWTMGGTGLFSDNYFYQVKEDGTGVVLLKQEKEEAGSQWDLGSYQEMPGVLADAASGRKYYMESDYTRNGNAESYRLDGYFYVENGTVYDGELRGYLCSYQPEGDIAQETYYDGAGNEITKEQWEQLYIDFSKGKEVVGEGLQWSVMTYAEAMMASEESILRMLTETVQK